MGADWLLVAPVKAQTMAYPTEAESQPEVSGKAQTKESLKAAENSALGPRHSIARYRLWQTSCRGIGSSKQEQSYHTHLYVGLWRLWMLGAKCARGQGSSQG